MTPLNLLICFYLIKKRSLLLSARCFEPLVAPVRSSTASEEQRLAIGLPALPTRRGARPPPSRGDWLLALPGRRDARPPDYWPACQARRVAASETWLLSSSLTRHVANASLPPRTAAAAGPQPTSVARRVSGELHTRDELCGLLLRYSCTRA